MQVFSVCLLLSPASSLSSNHIFGQTEYDACQSILGKEDIEVVKGKIKRKVENKNWRKGLEDDFKRRRFHIRKLKAHLLRLEGMSLSPLFVLLVFL
jgi:hypothetical protein